MTAVHWSTKCIQDLLFIFNLIFIVASGILFARVYYVIHTRYSNYMEVPWYGFGFIIAVGMITLIISFLGCCGAIKRNFCMTITFAILLILVFIFEIVVCICIYVLWADIFARNLNGAMMEYHNFDEIQNAVDTLQSGFHCCGIQGPSNWTQYLKAGDPMPFSCCNDDFQCNLNSTRLYTQGCVEAFSDYMSTYAAAAGGIAFCIALVQTLGIAFSCHLAKQIRKYNRF